MIRRLAKISLRSEDLAGLKVLVVDDNTNVQRLIGDVLRAGGVGQVESARDGLHARDKIASWDPDIIFSDWHMPVMDGLELTRLIRRAAVEPDGRTPNPQVPVVIVTGRRSEADVQLARKAGVNEFVIKPFTPAGILSRIQLVLQKPRPFVVSADYVGPDRRRRVELDYSGPLRRKSDPAEIEDEAERAVTRETMTIELEALRRLVTGRGGVDRASLGMIHRVLQHTTFRARQVRDEMVWKAAALLLEYVDGMGGHQNCEPKMLDVQFHAIGRLLTRGPADEARAGRVLQELEFAVRQKIGQHKAA
jgi:CheY-like chemotaxis protein